MTERLGRIPDDRLTAEQREAIDTYKSSRNEADISGPWIPLLRSPEVLVRTQALGQHLRYKTVLPPHLSELVILITARHWSQPYEWGLHSPIAMKAGVDRKIVDAIGAGRRPADVGEQAALRSARRCCSTRLRPPVYERALAQFGETGVVEAASMVGYYAMLAAILNTARTPAEPGMPALPSIT